MDVSVIIVNYKTSGLINDCIKSIFDKTEGVDYEIIVVDNNTENLSEVIAEADNPRVKLLQLPENVGFGRANNAGAKLAAGRNLFFLNPDTRLLNNAIKILSDYLDNHPYCGACGGNLYDKDMRPTHSFHHKMPGLYWEVDDLLNTFPEKFIHGKNRYFNYSGMPMPVGYIQGADLMMTKALFERLKGFSDEFFMYYEETDLCRRIKKEGYYVASIPQAEIMHYESASFDDADAMERKWRMVYASRRIYLRRAHSKLHNFFANRICRIFLFSRTILLKESDKQQMYEMRLRLFKDSIAG
ncbi:MAG: glycosyltransferase [Bacteroidales bacterium]|nr:glycosyltransferase [Bacteroidales bacterium]